MSRDQLVSAGAYALYRAEQGHRIAELGGGTDGDARIRGDFEAFRSRYVRKFQDFVDSLAEQGLTIRPGA
jgi:hypothetical protein